MKCKNSLKIDEYLKNELDQVERQKFEEHLKTCEDCSNELKLFGSMNEQLLILDAPDPGNDYFNTNLERIMEAVKRKDGTDAVHSRSSGFFLGFNLTKALAYTCAILLLVLGITIMNRHTTNVENMTLYIEDMDPYQIDLSESAASYVSALEQKYMEEISDEDPDIIYENINGYDESDEMTTDERSFLEELSDDDFKTFLKMFIKA